MSDEKDIKEAKEARAARREWLKIFSYRWITRNIPFFLFLAGLAVVYIYNGHFAIKTIRSIERTGKEIKELQYEYKTLKSEVMFRSKQSEIAREVDTLGLKELTVPPIVLRDSAYKADSLMKKR
ncbi:MAG: FtsL-like putative cell division protein [Pseudobacter sp.]|uniref:FtsL-like putative cell division protein n=1 Tax=Pseudobacter sp. TaxID=2045420 RepID=UPI003F7FD0E5